MQFSYWMSLIPDELQGRVNSVVRLIGFGFKPLGTAFVGILIVTITPRATILIFTVVIIVLALLATLNPHVRAAGLPAAL